MLGSSASRSEIGSGSDSGGRGFATMPQKKNRKIRRLAAREKKDNLNKVSGEKDNGQKDHLFKVSCEKKNGAKDNLDKVTDHNDNRQKDNLDKVTDEKDNGRKILGIACKVRGRSCNGEGWKLWQGWRREWLHGGGKCLLWWARWLLVRPLVVPRLLVSCSSTNCSKNLRWCWSASGVHWLCGF